MAIIPFLAMTAAEMQKVSDFPPQSAWMSCHFSPYSTGLINFPQNLPPHSLLILDDSTPIRGHDYKAISGQLLEYVEMFDCYGIFLDFQRPDEPEAAVLAKHLTQALPCPVILSEYYADDLTCPVFLSPVPPSVALEEYLAPWAGRDIWLEVGLTGEILTLTEQNCKKTPLSCPDPETPGFSEPYLHCHYRMDIKEKSVRFTLWRTKEDWLALLKNAESLGVTGAIGLFQELQHFP